MGKIFMPHELKSLVVDVENRKFLINGEEFGKGCREFTIHCTPDGAVPRFEVFVSLEQEVQFAAYDHGKLTDEIPPWRKR